MQPQNKQSISKQQEWEYDATVHCGSLYPYEYSMHSELDKIPFAREFEMLKHLQVKMFYI